MRLFVGVELDERVRAAAADAVEELRARLKRSRTEVMARWVAPENLHVTLWFIGEANDDRAAEIRGTLQRVLSTPAFELRARGCGAFPAAGPPRVFWLGITGGAEPMLRLYGEVKDRLVGIGFEPEKRPYSPHITIARVKAVRSRVFTSAGSSQDRDLTPRAARAVREALAGMTADCGACRIDAVTLFRSHLSPNGSRYEPLLRVPLS
jgi:2'-5' RNA ligase